MKFGYQHQQVVSSAVLTQQNLLLLLILLTSCCAQSIHYVTPTTDTPCPGEPCYTLSQYAADKKFNNLPANTTMEFLPGNHTLEQTISVTNLTRLTLRGNSSWLPEVASKIVCTQPAEFVLTGITELCISLLGFFSCGHNDSAAVNIISIQHSSLSNCSFYNSISTGRYNDSGRGALYIQNCDVILTGTIFQNNIADVGGVLNVDCSNLALTNNTFQNNTAGYDGGVLLVRNSTLTVTDNTFQNHSGGVLSVVNSNITVINNAFKNNVNTADYGSGEVFYVRASNLTITHNTFQGNTASDHGGVLYVEMYSILTVTDNIFQNNIARGYYGGVLFGIQSNLKVTNNTFQNNSAFYYGGVLYVRRSILIVTDNTFENNFANTGGVLYAKNCTLIVTDNTFKNNSADTAGGSIGVETSSINFIDNNFTDSCAEGGGAISINNQSTVRMYGRNIIKNNQARYHGGGISALDSQLHLLENTIFENNRARYGGGLYAHNTEYYSNGNTSFINNMAFEGGGGIYASKSWLFFTENTTIIKNNSALDGGGLLLSGDSKLHMQPNITTVHFISNSANHTGGAINVKESNPLTYCLTAGFNSECFFQIGSLWYNILTFSQLKNFSNSLNVKRIMIHFDNNSAVEAGADLYGGYVDNCTFSNIIIRHRFYSGPSPSGYIFDVITSSGNESTTNISSDPLDICICVHDWINCTNSYHPKPVYPGETLEVSVIAHGQRNGATVAVVQAIDASNNITHSNLEIFQSINSSCTPLKYTIQSRAVGTTQDITLHAKGPCPPTETNILTISVDILPCPPGFQLSETQPICICAKRLQKFTKTCIIHNATVLRKQDALFWVGYNESTGLILHPYCPFDYCTSEETYFAVKDSDKQCNYNRSGLLCGTCSENLSLALGSSHCLQCSNHYFSLLAVFAFIGIALVLLILVLRLTVAAGTINGLILYANVVAVDSAIFFKPNVPKVPIAKVLTVFIAWLNLDLGIETCFYNGMDAYVKTWLQFAFPLYVWALVGMIIIGSHYSGRVAKVFGSNPIAVLATLFLLSYAKLLRTIIATLSYTSLQYPNNSQIAVWLYDGNIRYLSGKHIPLFTVAMVCLIFLVLPYTMLLIFGQWLQAKSALKIFSCINSHYVKPFRDAYHAPYTNKHRYWTGLMLLLRFALFLSSAVNALGDPSVNLLATASTTAAVLTLPTILNTRIYKTWTLRLLETSFILNLNILAVATLYIRSRGGNQNAATFTSVGIAFATFTGIVIYHSIQQIKNTRLWKRVSLRHDYTRVPPTNVDSGPEDPPDLVFVSGSAPTQTVVDIRNSKPREPCMETD